MFAIADTDRLVADGVITPEQAREIEGRARDGMIVLAINALLCIGSLAATGGLILWLASAQAVAICGTLALIAGIAILTRGRALFRMFGNAAALIGAGMLMGGAAMELLSSHPDQAGTVMTLAGGILALLAGGVLWRPGRIPAFVSGAILIMALSMHLGGLGYLVNQHGIAGLPVSLFYLYCTAVIVAVGLLSDVRLVTALAIVPFAQALDTGTFYFKAAYVFYSPEATLSILQMAALIALCLWLARHLAERSARHARVLAVLAFVVANLCALVGSIWGDVVGETLWGPGSYGAPGESWEEHHAALEAFRAHALQLSPGLYAVLWALVLVLVVVWAAHRSQRGLFNAALTFGAIHAYTQFFESFWDEPFAYVLGGLVAIPIAWGMWWLNRWLGLRRAATPLQ